jgi:hypothetical protein
MATTITGTTIDVGTNVIVTDAAGKVGVGTASPANYYADELVVTAADEGGMTLVTGTGHANYIAFADGTSGNEAYRGFVKYDHANDKMTLGTAGTSAIEVNVIGNVTKPLQPAFQVRPATAQTNIPVGGNNTVVLGTEVFDIGSNFASNTFTAPVTGKYQLNFTIRLDDIDTAANYYQHAIITSNRQYYVTQSLNRFSADVQYWNMATNTVLADMDAGDTAYINVIQSNGTSQTDVATDSTLFSGFLAC